VRAIINCFIIFFFIIALLIIKIGVIIMLGEIAYVGILIMTILTWILVIWAVKVIKETYGGKK
jgi:hypothetical protein